MMNRTKKTLFILLALIVICSNFTYSQKNKYSQFWAELRFNGTINKKWATEFDFRSKNSSQLNDNNAFNTNIQKSYTGWAHYYGGARWKFSTGIGYFDNKNAPDIGLLASPEWRLSLQGTYYIHKVGYTLSTRMRLEIRETKTSDEYGELYRYRQQIKYLQPINSKFLRQGVFYAFASEEIFLQGNSKENGLKFLNRNELKIGGGYLFTDDFHVELSYLNDYQPRDEQSNLTNIYSIKIIYNNLGKKIIGKILPSKQTPEEIQKTVD